MGSHVRLRHRVGAFIAAYTGGEITAAWIPTLWADHFVDSLGLRLGAAFTGGAVMAFGARLGRGCTSGHGISGTLQLSVGSCTRWPASSSAAQSPRC